MESEKLEMERTLRLKGLELRAVTPSHAAVTSKASADAAVTRAFIWSLPS